MKASFTGTVVFGQLPIEVKAFPVTGDTGLHMQWVHRTCRAPLKTVATCPTCEAPVADGEMIKSLEAEGTRLVFEKKELDALTPEPDEGRPILVHQVVDIQKIDPLCYDRTYYLTPANEEGVKPYTLFSRVLRMERGVAVVTFISHSKERLAIIRPGPEGLLLQTLFFHEEMRTLTQYGMKVEEVKLNPLEIQLARKLMVRIRQQGGPFAYAKYTNQTKARLSRIIKARLRNVPAPPIPEPMVAPPKPSSLVESLQASIKQAQQIRKAQVSGRKQTKKVG